MNNESATCHSGPTQNNRDLVHLSTVFVPWQHFIVPITARQAAMDPARWRRFILIENSRSSSPVANRVGRPSLR